MFNQTTRNTVKLSLKHFSLLLVFALAEHAGMLNAQQTVFAVIGDFGGGTADETTVAELVKSWNPQFVITAGDNRYSNTNYDLTIGRDYCEFLSGAGQGTYCDGNGAGLNAFFPSPGNHDHTDGGGIDEYKSYFDIPGEGIAGSGSSGSELYYDFIRGPVHFFVIDSYDAIVNNSMDTQQTWLQNQLEASTARWNIVYFHHSPYSSSIRHGSIPEMQWPFAQWGADVVISGHDHTYERLEYDGITYFVNGVGGWTLFGFSSILPGSMAHYNAEFGAQRVVVTDTTMTFSFIDINGQIIDVHELHKTNPVNHAPVFSSDTIAGNSATEDSLYHFLLGEWASDPDGDVLHYSIISGPAWLTAASDGELSGTPLHADVGLNSWIVEVDDSKNGTDQATLQINVSGRETDPLRTANTISPKGFIHAYPNPASEWLVVELNGWGGNKSLTFYSSSGKIIYTESFHEDQIELDVSSYPEGMYLLKISGEKLSDCRIILIR